MFFSNSRSKGKFRKGLGIVMMAASLSYLLLAKLGYLSVVCESAEGQIKIAWIGGVIGLGLLIWGIAAHAVNRRIASPLSNFSHTIDTIAQLTKSLSSDDLSGGMTFTNQKTESAPIDSNRKDDCSRTSDTSDGLSRTPNGATVYEYQGVRTILATCKNCGGQNSVPEGEPPICKFCGSPLV